MMTVGGYKRDLFNTSYRLITHYVSGSFHWALHIVRFSFNGKWYNIKASQALTDTGSTSLLMSQPDYDNFLVNLNRNLPNSLILYYGTDGNLYYLNCNDPLNTFPSIRI
jgi:hypothetical protein